MFRRMSAHGHFSEADARTTRDGSDDSSWISVFSLVSRPAWSLLQRYLPGRAQTAFDMKSNLDIGNSLMGGLGETSLKGTYLHLQHENAACASSEDPGTLAWLTQDSLSELGIQNTAQKDFNMQRQASVGYLGTARNLLSQVLLYAPSKQEKVRTASERGSTESGCVWCADTVSTRSANTWWLGGFWGPDDSPQNWLLNVPQSRQETDTSWQHRGEHHSVGYCQSRAKAIVTKTTELCVRGTDGGSMHNESTGPLCSKELAHNESLHMPKPDSLPNSYQLPLDEEYQNVFKLIVCSRAYSEVAVLTPDQDNGYSSLEEEHSLNKLRKTKLLSEEHVLSETGCHLASEEMSFHSNTTGNESVEQAQSESATYGEEIKQSEEDAEFFDPEKTAETSAPAVLEDLPILPTPHCQNKVIAYIMGSPCSGESESEDEGDWDSNDDDGFDSEGSSHFSEAEDLDDSDDETEEDSEEDEADTETERLWNSLCQNGDPYNPRNFTAPIRTASKPSPATDSSVSESPPAHMSSHLSPLPSPPSLSENESSEEACEMDEDDNQRLWNSFSCSADPYSLLNFQAPIQTQKPPKRCRKMTLPGIPCYKREEAEERLDSGFSEISLVPCSSSATSVQLKKVKFVEDVEEFYASSDEDRHGPWEEIARDRCRFQRRVQEVEETISYCLSPTFRLVIFQRLFSTS
ncbi:protein phosphatase 1 regulatory subunit 15B [Myxocyprinus asiaticus]|uniref:protein phosphatase 1 regulatory subunit 15B n=1 Tax=Myxocyprinus asiaticus TaxID=70543 RepID=UPI002221D6C0|nr:protein phosphatase 1 regulatory subunit 15B [Myxocyprinus asiaticus]